jgi:glutamate N-acetyltransferase/amino-acid N-acetyltransferase
MGNIKFIDGGVCAPQGFTANGMRVGIKASRKINDTALVYSEVPCNAAGVFTKNRVKSESVKITQKHLADGKAQAAIEISGNANTCTGPQGAENAFRMAKAAATALGIKTEDVMVYSTGVIGAQFDVTKVEANINTLKAGLSKKGHEEARIAIMTTDTHYKECAVEFELGGKICRMGTMCKGSGMIHINMGTMLSFITTDCAISSEMLSKALHESILGTYNCVSVDGDTSTNDSLIILANGMAGNAEITSEGADFDAFVEALNALNTQMAKKIAADGEGATRLVTCNVVGADTVENARGLAKAVICSNLVKAAFFGADANWGRILDAMGYSGFFFTPEKTSVSFLSREGAKRYFEDGNVNGGKENSIKVFDHGVPLNFDEDLAKKILTEEAVDILVELEDGSAKGTAWGCDLTYDYVKINGDYRT